MYVEKYEIIKKKSGMTNVIYNVEIMNQEATLKFNMSRRHKSNVISEMTKTTQIECHVISTNCHTTPQIEVLYTCSTFGYNNTLI